MSDAPGFTMEDVRARAPDLAVLRMHRRAAPALPLDLFGPFCSGWISDAAEGASAPPDYTAVALLAGASALIGNSRLAHAWGQWTEPPILWCAAIGDPSSGKSPGADPVMRILANLEEQMGADHPTCRRRWETDREGARARKSQWLGEVKDAAKLGNPPPPIPADADDPPEPVRPRVRATDATLDKLSVMLAGLPKGLLYTRDELAGWIGSFDRYSGGGDRAFWIEAYGGRSYTVDRVKHPEPLHIPHLSVAIFGGMQPDRLSALTNDADDGLLPRFLFAWPEKAPYRRPERHADQEAGLRALSRLAGLSLEPDASGITRPVPVALTHDATDVLHEVIADMRSREAGGMLAGAIGKASGHVLRLALVLEFLWWCGEPCAPQPTSISAAAVQTAAALMETYFLPMAERAFGDAGAAPAERNAATLAKWIVRERLSVVNVRAVRDSARLQGLREAPAIKDACMRLVDAAWLFEPVRDASTGGRPREDYRVNPALWPALR